MMFTLCQMFHPANGEFMFKPIGVYLVSYELQSIYIYIYIYSCSKRLSSSLCSCVFAVASLIDQIVCTMVDDEVGR